MTLGTIATVGAIGSVAGQGLASRLDAATLPKLFGVTVIVIAAAMLGDLLL